MDNSYRTISGDAWDIVSLKVYGSEDFLDVLIEANPEHRETMIFSAGVILTVPDLPQSTQNNRNLPPWRRNA